MKGTKTLISGAILTALACTVGANTQAADLSKLTTRVRAIYIDPEDQSTAIPALNAPANAIDVESKWAPDIDFEYALTERVGLELLLTIPQRHEVVVKQSALGSNVKLGTVDHLPPTLTAKYYFATGAVRPYVGGGVNFTYFTGSDLALGVDIKKTSFGPALQAGMDLFYNDNWSLSFDVKKVWIDTEASLNGQRLGIINVNPWIYGLGVGYRFGGAKAAPVVAAAPPPPPPPPAPVAPPPPADSDHDGVIDANDRCPNTVAGAKVDANGCELDSDHDGVVDRLDKCPGTPAGAKVDATGCETVITLKGVNFETNSAKLTASSTSILDNAVTVLKQRSGAKVEVQGHTDSVGKDAYNLSLSSHRAKAVLDYLVAHGVDAKMLTSKGYGEAQPIASNDTAEGRAENRRVDLKFQ